jgi:uncharacterized protein YndB with AHSA1/START domain
MGSFELQIRIERPASEVFRYVSDVRNAPAWFSAVQTAEQVAGQGPGPGARYAITRELPQGRVEDEVRTTEFEPPTTFAFGTEGGSTPFSYRYALVEEDDGSTVLRLEGTIEPSGPARLLGPIATAAFKRGMAANLERLRAELEPESPRGR